MMTLFTMTTLSNWTKSVQRVAIYPSLETLLEVLWSLKSPRLMPVFSIFFLAICSLGLNMS